MENAHSHQSQSVVRGGQIVFQRKLAIATAQIVYPIYLIVIQLPAVGCEAHFQLADQLFLERRVTDGVQIIQVGPLGLAGAEMVQINLVFHFFLCKKILIGILFLKIGTDESNVRWEDPLILNLPPFSFDPNAQVTGFVFHQITATEFLVLSAAESYARRKVVQPRGCLSLGILAAIRRLSPAAAGVLCRVSDRL